MITLPKGKEYDRLHRNELQHRVVGHEQILRGLVEQE